MIHINVFDLNILTPSYNDLHVSDRTVFCINPMLSTEYLGHSLD